MSRKREVPEMALLSERMCKVLYDALKTEMRRAARGRRVPAETILEAALSALMSLFAVCACQIMSPEKDFTTEPVRARSRRLHVAFCQAARRIIESEDAAIDIRGHA